MPSLGAIICPVGLMDKTMDSGSINVGSIPARDATWSTGLSLACAFYYSEVF